MQKKIVLPFSLNIEKYATELSFSEDRIQFMFLYAPCLLFQEAGQRALVCVQPAVSHDFSSGSWFKHKWNNSIIF